MPSPHALHQKGRQTCRPTKAMPPWFKVSTAVAEGTVSCWMQKPPALTCLCRSPCHIGCMLLNSRLEAALGLQCMGRTTCQAAGERRIIQLTNADAIDGAILAGVASLLHSRLTASHRDSSRGQAVLVQRALQRQQGTVSSCMPQERGHRHAACRSQQHAAQEQQSDGEV